MRRAALSTLTVLGIVVAVALTAGLGDASRPHPADHAIAAASPTVDRPGPSAQLATAQAVAGYVELVQRQQVVDYLAARARADLEAYLASLPAPATSDSATSSEVPESVSPQVSASAGAHSDAWWQAVSVCEQSGRNDPYFGYFSIMDGSAGGLPWATQVQMANAIIARAGDGAWAASCVAAGYGASPSG